MNAWWAAALAGAVCGLLSGLGIGGGTLLMVWMTGVAALPQQTAQGINLLYFLPSAACALFFHIRNRLIRWDIVLPAALGGCVTAAIAAWIATGAGRLAAAPPVRRLPAAHRPARAVFPSAARQERQIALEDQRGGDGVDGIFALFPVIIAVAQDLVCLNGRPSFIPEHDLHTAGSLDRGGHLAVQRRARPSVPSILRGNPITSRSAALSCTSAAMASAVCCGRRLWMTVVRPTMLPLASEMAIPVRASP